MVEIKKQTVDSLITVDRGETREVRVLSHQKPVIRDDNRIVTAIGGVQSGKTMAALMGLARILAENPGETCWLLAPVFSQLESVGLKKMRSILASMDLYDDTDPSSWNKSRHYLQLTNGAKLRYISASDPEKFQGNTTPGVMIDEISEVEERILDVALQRTAVMEGTVYLSGLIPHPGQLIGHWIYDRIYKPYEEGDPDISMYTFTSLDNPFFSKSRFEKAKEEMPEDVFAAEYKGEFRETTLSDNVFIPSSVDFSQRRWGHRVKYLPENLYFFIKEKTRINNLPEHEKESIAKAQGSYLREEPDKEDNQELWIAWNKYKSAYGRARYNNDDEESDYEQIDPEAGLIKYGLEEQTDPLLTDPDIDPEKLSIGVDVADEGGDLNVATIRWHNTILGQLSWMASTDKVVEHLINLNGAIEQLDYDATFWVDSPGMGKAIVNDLRKEDITVREFWPSKKPPEETRRYLNIKSWAFFEGRRRLLDGIDAIPPDSSKSNLRRQLLSQKYTSTSKSKLKIKKDSNNSPDFCDSYVISILPVTAGMNPVDNVFFF